MIEALLNNDHIVFRGPPKLHQIAHVDAASFDISFKPGFALPAIITQNAVIGIFNILFGAGDNAQGYH